MFYTSRNFFTTFTMDGYDVSDASLFALARVGYDIPVARRLRLRVGLGAGVGFHEIYYISRDKWGGEGQLPDLPHMETLPHLLADIHWVWRVGRNLELQFAPLLLSPSQFIFRPWNDEYYSGGYYGYNLIPVRLGVRF